MFLMPDLSFLFSFFCAELCGKWKSTWQISGEIFLAWIRTCPVCHPGGNQRGEAHLTMSVMKAFSFTSVLSPSTSVILHSCMLEPWESHWYTAKKMIEWVKNTKNTGYKAHQGLHSTSHTVHSFALHLLRWWKTAPCHHWNTSHLYKSIFSIWD